MSTAIRSAAVPPTSVVPNPDDGATVNSESPAQTTAPSQVQSISSAPSRTEASQASGSTIPERDTGAQQLIRQHRGGNSAAAQFAAAQFAAAQAENREQTSATSQQRMGDIPMQLLHGDAGVTEDGEYYAEGALLKGKQGTLQAEILGVHGQVGMQSEVGATLARLSIHDDGGDTTLEALTLNASWGSQQAKDGRGAGQGSYGVAANALGVETTRELDGGHSVTLGVSAGLSAKLDLDVKDTDHDGHAEECAKISLGPVSLGACVEPHDVITSLAKGAQAVGSWLERP